ncbi:MAG: PhoH family protein [Lysobacterales bacterium]
MPPETSQSDTDSTVSLTLSPQDSDRLAAMCGPHNTHITQVEERLGVKISNRGGQFSVRGAGSQRAAGVLRAIYEKTAEGSLSREEVNLQLQTATVEAPPGNSADTISIRTKRGTITGRGPNQQAYLKNIFNSDITFGIGPAGTGKTFLAVACAVQALEQQQVSRLVLVRPAVEAGERLGFLPGDMAQKVDPYLRPLFDALYEMLGFERVEKLMERNVIEVAPLAFMRGRTLNDAFIILDEAQNTSVEQMKMFLTRLGFGSRAVVTGDVTQVDLPRHQTSGLTNVISILKQVPGVSFIFFQSKDVVRHALVQRIVDAYQANAQSDSDA